MRLWSTLAMRVLAQQWHFTLANVAVPYQAIVVTSTSTGRQHGYASGPVSVLDPTLQLLFDATGSVHTATVSGTTGTGHTPGVTGSSSPI